MPRFLVLADFAGQIAAIGPGGGSLVTGNLHVSRDFIDVAHVVTALIALAETPAASGVVNVCSGVADSLQELVTRMVAQSGKAIRMEVDHARVRAGEPHVIVGSNRRLAALGFDVPPTPMLALVDALLADAQRTAALT
jgi:GDP-4-dehydro-6-deoxy-D-mannose reductase